MCFSLNFFFNKISNKNYSNKLQLNFSKNIPNNDQRNYFISHTPFKFLFKNKFFKFIKLLCSIFEQNKNILLVDYNYNYNYLPIKNSNLFSRSNKNLSKYFNYFNISIILFLNLNKKKFIFKKLQNHKTINVTLGYGMYSNKFDLCLDVQNTKIIHYIVYIYIIGIYLNVKNNDLNTSGSTLFLF